MKFEHKKPFRTKDDTVVTMKARYVIHGIESIEVYEHSNRLSPDNLTPMSEEEYNEHLKRLEENENI